MPSIAHPLQQSFLRFRSLLAAVEHSAALERRNAEGLLSALSKKRTISEMGSSWSTPSKSPHDNETLRVERTSIHSPPRSKFCAPLDLAISFDAKQLAKMARTEAAGSWHVELEVDVAHLQTRHTLLIANADLSAVDHRLYIPSSKFLEIMKAPDVTVDSICNICAIHAGLYGDEKRSERVADVTIVIDVSRDGYDSGSEVSSLIRRVYGVTDASRGNGLTS